MIWITKRVLFVPEGHQQNFALLQVLPEMSRICAAIIIWAVNDEYIVHHAGMRKTTDFGREVPGSDVKICKLFNEKSKASPSDFLDYLKFLKCSTDIPLEFLAVQQHTFEETFRESQVSETNNEENIENWGL